MSYHSLTKVGGHNPGGLDILTNLLPIYSNLKKSHSCQKDQERDREDLDFFLKRWENECGQVRHGHIGVNRNGWCSDWALISLGDEWKGANGDWMDDLYFKMSRATADKTLTGSGGIVTSAEPMTNIICYKDGALEWLASTYARSSGKEQLKPY